MSILITEIAIDASGQIAIEITNTGSTSYDLFNHELYLGDIAANESSVVFGSFALDSIAAGQTVTIGHDSIHLVEYAPNDSVFSQPSFAYVYIRDFSGPSVAYPDSVGTRFPGNPAFGTDIVYTCDTTRAPDTDPLNGDNRADFTVTTPFSTNTLLSPTIACFAEGTRIATPDGEKAVETLAIGDRVTTQDGRAVPLLWLGRQTLVRRFAGRRAQLVRIAAGALGNHSDLYVTGDHGMALGGYVINAAALVNGSSIAWMPMAQTPARQVVYHVETEAHDMILANGAVAETFVDYEGRQAFDNFAEYEALYRRERMIAESPLPRIASARLLPAEIRKRFGIAEVA